MSDEHAPGGRPGRRPEREAGRRQRPRRAEPPPIAKGLAFFLVGLVGLHFAATFLWNAPLNPVKEAIGDQVSGYMRPFFEQNFSLFAPNPINAEDELLVRARVADPQTGDIRTTGWLYPTRLEWRIVHHNPAPSRASRLSSNLHRRLSSSWDRLSDEQQDIVARDYEDIADWRPLADDLIAAQGGETSSRVASIVRADRVAAGYATQFAKATWGQGIVAVQFRLRRTPVPRWDERKEPVPDDPSYSTREFGWRPVLVDDNQNESLFASTIARLEGHATPVGRRGPTVPLGHRSSHEDEWWESVPVARPDDNRVPGLRQ